jgi:predicted DNA-binding transcriptional regulator YafY
MSKRESTIRYLLIIRKLHAVKYASFDEIAKYLLREFELLGDNFNISKRTFQRDISDIWSIFRIDIEYNHSEKAYYIENEFDPEINDRLFEAFDVYNALKVNEQNRQYIYLEKRKAEGTEHLYGLLHAIKNRLQISFSYQRYDQDHSEQRIVNPLELKEFKCRWYLIARNEHDKQVRRYALDRVSDLDISRLRFPKDTDFDIDKMYKHCFGVIYPGEVEPQRVVLSFNHLQGKYIKSLPLHKTQKILIDNDKELRISLNIYLTYDFKQEILSYGENVKVLEPESFVKELKETYCAALKQY